MWRKFTMPVTQLTHARHQNIYQMCGTTWNAFRWDRIGSEEGYLLYPELAATDGRTDGWMEDRAPPNNNVKYVRRFAIHTQKWMRQQQHRAAHLNPVRPANGRRSTVATTAYATENEKRGNTITHCLEENRKKSAALASATNGDQRATVPNKSISCLKL